jgi:hypothetical protein
VAAIEIRVRAPKSVVLVSDRDAGEIPETFAGELVAATRSCIAVGTYCSDDGPTMIRIGRVGDLILAPEDPIVFDGEIGVPSGQIVLSSVFGEIYAELPLDSRDVHVQIRANHPTEPDRFVITLNSQEPLTG